MLDDIGDKLARARDGARIAHMLPLLERELDALEGITRARVYSYIQAGELTADRAMLGWMELNVLDRLRKRLRQFMAVGSAQGVE